MMRKLSSTCKARLHPETSDDGNVVRWQGEGEAEHDVPQLVDDVLDIELAN